jgi:glycosyltransferase involved in cell wall biosynthesis
MKDGRFKILFLAQICPYPPTNGGAIKSYNILKHLGSKHQVTLLTFVRSDSEVASLEHLRAFCSEIDFCKITRSAFENCRNAVRSLVSAKPFIILRDLQPEMVSKVHNALQWQPDLVYVDHLQMFQYVPEGLQCPVVLDNHNVEWLIIRRFASTSMPIHQRFFASIEWRKLRKYEICACRRADLVITVTENDRNILIANGVPAWKVVSLPIGVHVSSLQPVELARSDRKITTFGTMSWPPNVDSVVYFARMIYPRIKRCIPGVQFNVIGKNPPSKVLSLARKDFSIKVLGYVEELCSAVIGTAAFVVPLRIGSGMRVKILDAMAMGLPVVTTSIGCEGIDLKPGEHALVVDSPSEFAEAVVYLIQNYEARVRLGKSGRAFVEQHHSWPSILEQLDRSIYNLVA